MIRKVIEGRNKAQKARDAKVNVYDSEEILGSMKVVREFALFAIPHKEDLEVAKTALLIDYCNNMRFTPEQLEAYKLGQEGMYKLFLNCESDLNLYLQQQNSVNNKSK